MVQILTLPTGFLAANCYMIFDDKTAEKSGVIIDPGSEPAVIIKKVRQENISIKAVFITHGHYDHVGAIAEVVKEFNCPVFMGKKDQELYSGQADFIASIGGDVHDAFEYFEDGKEFFFTEEMKFRILSTPGHSQGGVCLVLSSMKSLFTGDTLFEGTVGRTDLPGSDPDAMKISLRKLIDQFPDYKIYPGHGDSTTMREEMDSNPFLRRLAL